nr:catalase [Pseudomonas sp. S11P7]
MNRNPLNYFAEVEQAALWPGATWSGVLVCRQIACCKVVYSLMPTPHRYRVGTNHQQLPVNAPRSPVNTYQA